MELLRLLLPNVAPYRVEIRRAAGAPWAPFAQAMDEAMARDEAAGPPEPPEVGALLRLLDPLGETVCLWVGAAEGFVDPGPPPPTLGRYGADWVAAWEGGREAGHVLLAAAEGVDPFRLALAACDAALAVAGHLLPTSLELRGSLVAARRELDPEGVPAAPPARGDKKATTARACNAAHNAAYNALDAHRDALRGDGAAAQGYAVRALHNAAQARGARLGPDHATVRRRLLPRVLAHLPLAVVLLARAGQPTPRGLPL